MYEQQQTRGIALNGRLAGTRPASLQPFRLEFYPLSSGAAVLLSPSVCPPPAVAPILVVSASTRAVGGTTVSQALAQLPHSITATSVRGRENDGEDRHIME
jgi:hypothetical protein